MGKSKAKREQRISNAVARLLRDGLDSIQHDSSGAVSVQDLQAHCVMVDLRVSELELRRTLQGCRLVELVGSGNRQLVRALHSASSPPRPAKGSAASCSSSKPEVHPVVDDGGQQEQRCSEQECLGQCGKLASLSIPESDYAQLIERGAASSRGTHALRAFGVQSIQDIAFLVVTYDEAKGMGFPTEWFAARACGTVIDREQARDLLNRSTPATKAAAPPDAQPQHKPASRPGRTALGPQVDNENRVKAAEALAEVAKSWGGAISQQARADMVARLSQFEARSIYSRIRAWEIYTKFCSDAHVSPFAPEGQVARIQAACLKQNGLTGPSSLWDRLDFLRRQALAPLSMPPRPPRQAKDGVVVGQQSGLVLEPEMAARFEAFAPILQERHDWRLGILLGALFIARSCTRFAHMQRAELRERSTHSVWALCYRGKAGGKRGRPAFRFCAPRMPLLANTPSPVDMLWCLWAQMRARHGSSCNYLIMDACSGNAVSMSTFHACLRELAIESAAASTPEFLTSKSCRMVHPTLCDLRGADWGERMAVGCWTDCPDATKHGRHSIIPILYQGDREASAAFVKVLNFAMLRSCLQQHRERHSGLDAVPPLLWSGLRKYIGDDILAKAKQEATAKFNDEDMLEAMDGVPLEPKRSFGIKPHPVLTPSTSAEAAKEAPQEDTSPADGSATDADVTSSEDVELTWIHRDSYTSVLHIESDVECVPWCWAASGKALKGPNSPWSWSPQPRG